MNLFVTRYFIAVVFIVLILQLAFSFTAAYNREHENKWSVPKQVVFFFVIPYHMGVYYSGILCQDCAL